MKTKTISFTAIKVFDQPLEVIARDEDGRLVTVQKRYIPKSIRALMKAEKNRA